jgi:hypothetical protein
MDRGTLEQYLAQAEDRIDTSRRLVERQSTLIVRLKEDGHAIDDAEELLDQFERSLRMMIVDRDVILRLLRSATR